ncbi:hypothetical protein BMF94_5560 [Rhodotorula taiwanensis]|uniref:HMG box domain-containing protein n=1 Tax=Rhodotorula taiwanensis TaxID=741276 RepID=A0A2S5B381_9BASI|nr:hypothetical protein BMF94_5560 [Rhodotorula taiwanensis]
MADKKAAVVKALQQLGATFKQLSRAQADANEAVLDYANAIDKADDPSELLASFPNMFGDIATNPSAARGTNGDVIPKKRGRKEKKEKDPNAPKRPPSAYIEYQNSVREDFRKQYSDLPYSEVLKKIGLVWQGMTEAEKKAWHDITEKKKHQYLADKTAYEGEHGIAPVLPAPPKEPKKRGRKSNAEKAAMAAAAAAAADIPVVDAKKKKSILPGAPGLEADFDYDSQQPESESDSDDSDDGEDDDEDTSSESESEASPAPVVAPVKKDKHKSKKAKN